MRSEFADKFNHDQDAPTYDVDVQDASDPIRAGYSALLDWVVERAEPSPDARVLDLGVGTGTLSLRLPCFGQLVCIDVSEAMLEQAEQKLRCAGDVTLVTADLLEYFDQATACFDAVLSTYAVHHLTEGEKARLFELVRARLSPGGRAVFGDLMFADNRSRRESLAQYRTHGRSELADAIEDEFFWNVETAVKTLEQLDFAVETRRFSELSWGIAARLPAGASPPAEGGVKR